MPDLAGTGNFLFEVRDRATLAPIPAKITLVGVGQTASPRFSAEDAPVENGRAMLAWNKIMTLSGEGRVDVPPGMYDVYVSRGPEWSIDVRKGFEIGSSDVFVDAKLSHQVETPGWISGDFHVHAAPSWDSSVPLRARVFEFVCEGVDVIASTDHNIVSDYAPVIVGLSVGDFITSIHGDEVTTKDWGHFGAIPLPVDEARGVGAGVAAKGRTPTQIFRDVRALEKDALITVNHPRFERGLGYFNTAQFDRDKIKFGRIGASLEFDAVEVLNGYEGAAPEQVDAVLEDWFALLRHGHLVAATGNSDTHHLNYSLGGYPRNYVKVPDDHPSATKPGDVVAGVRAKQSLLTTGPFVELRVGSQGIGSTTPADHGRIKAHVVVRAADWVGTDELTLYLGGKIVATRKLGSSSVVRFDGDIDVDIEGKTDTFLVARVGAKDPLPVIVGDGAKLVAWPIAVTNPIWIDVDGDGRYTP